MRLNTGSTCNEYSVEENNSLPVHGYFNFIDRVILITLTENFIEFTGAIFPASLGDDFEEIDFENHMKRKKRNKKMVIFIAF